MCTIVTAPDGTEYGTVEELRRIWPEIIADKRYGQVSESGCLCQIDVAATAVANGAPFRYDRGFDELFILAERRNREGGSE